MGERYVREVYDDDLHMGGSRDGDGSHRGLQYDDDNHLKGHAKYYEDDERDIYENLKEKYETESDEYEYDYEFDAEAFQKKVEIAEIVVAIAVAVSPYVKDWFVETAIPGVKGLFRGIKEKFTKKKDKVEEAEIIEVTYQVTPESSLALANEIEKAEQKYHKKMTSTEAQQELIAIVMAAMELSRRINDLADAEIQDTGNAIVLATGWDSVIDALTKENLIEGVNRILESGTDQLNAAQLEQLQSMLGRNLYLDGVYKPLSVHEMHRILGQSNDDDGEDIGQAVK